MHTLLIDCSLRNFTVFAFAVSLGKAMDLTLAQNQQGEQDWQQLLKNSGSMVSVTVIALQWALAFPVVCWSTPKMCRLTVFCLPGGCTGSVANMKCVTTDFFHVMHRSRHCIIFGRMECETHMQPVWQKWKCVN